MSSATLSEVLDALDRGALLVLPHARAARGLRSAFDARQRARGVAAWEPPKICSWSQWANSLWSELVVEGAETRLLLNGAQEHSLWREVLVEDTVGAMFDSLAELARSAWQLAAAYSATQRLREFAVTHDSRVFAGWADEFSKRCAARGYLSEAMLDAALLDHVQRGAIAATTPVELVGFREMQPSQEALVAGLREYGIEVHERTLEADAGAEELHAVAVASNEREELLLAARWIRGFLERANANGDDARVAVLVPNLAEDREELSEVLRATLAPELESIQTDLSSTPWEFSGGTPLSSLAMIADVLALARWAEDPLPLGRVSSLLLSPYVGQNGAPDRSRDASARFDMSKLRRTLLLRSEIEIPDLLDLADGDTALLWLREVQRFLQQSTHRNRARSFAEWMEFMRGVARASNWPGERALTATEFEAAQAWEGVLDLVSTLDFSGRRVTFSVALDALALEAQRAIFAPPATGASVQVMRVNEAEGSVFDAVSFLRATDANLPAVERVNPLLPWALQRSLKMPGSDAARTAERSRAFVGDILRCSGSVLFTYAMEDESGKMRPSPLLTEMGIEVMDAEELTLPAVTAERPVIETAADDSKLPALPSNEVMGGAAVLKLQAACGFLAFAELRLQATEPKQGDIGLDAGDSGSLLHRTLQIFWKEVETQETLRSLSWAEREGMLAHAIDKAMPRRLLIRDGWDQAYIALQKERLRSVLHRWMEEELKRGPFTVLAVEESQVVTVGTLTLGVRMDRIDKVGEGIFFVDYKTGYVADPKQWIGGRPDDPQLPLYTLLPEAEELKGVAFAKVRTGRDMKWLGYQAEEGILPASRSKANVRDFTILVDEWRETLTQLAEDFAAGRADVRPKSFEMNCARCAQRLLCRLDPTTLLAAVDEDEEDVEGIDG